MATTTNLRFLRDGLMAVGACAGLALGTIGFTASAEARAPTGPVPDGVAAVCSGLQKLYDNEVELEQAAVGTFAKGQHHRTQIALQDQWETAGCKQYYGSIATIVSRPTIARTPALQVTAN